MRRLHRTFARARDGSSPPARCIWSPWRHGTDPKDKNAATNPTTVEVLSETTEATDRGEVRAPDALQPARVILVELGPGRQVEVFRRNPDDTWTLHEFTGGLVRLQSIDVAALADIYADPLAPTFQAHRDAGTGATS